jgi:pimeloyl-ACP methyl ester carboxylesterase
MRFRFPAGAACIAVFSGLFTSGCVFFDAHKQQQLLDANCVIEGNARSARADPRPIVVVLARRTEGDAASHTPWQIVDHFVLERPGHWMFIAAAGNYGIAAFEDANRDLVYQPGEPFVGPEANAVLCAPGGRIKDIALSIPAVASSKIGRALDIAALQARSVDDQMNATLGQLTAVGELASLSDARFSEDNAESGLWRPFDFLFNARAGIYFLQPYDPAKVPVLFVHGINGTPLNFDYLIEHLDRTQFQPWVYYYPSGAHLAAIADHLTQTMTKLQQRYHFKRFAVVAHSMGGLVSRGFILRYSDTGGAGAIPLFMTISTPWGGHKAAELGVKTAPVVVRVWYDMAPGSDYLRSIFSRPLPAGTVQHLVFTFNRNGNSFGESNDHTVTVASELLPQAQREALRSYGFDDTHMSVLQDPEVSSLLDRLLVQYYR